MKTFSIRSIFILLLTVIVLSCTSPNESNPIIDQSDSYIPLYKGIEKEFISYEDSLQVFTEIVGKVIREDGQNLFIKKNRSFRYKSEFDISFGTSNQYFYNKDGFQIETDIVRTDNNTSPFWERRVSKESPKNNEIWDLNPNPSATNNWLVKTEYVGDMETLAGVFHDVYKYEIVDSTFGYPDTTRTYFSKGVGEIAYQDSYLNLILNYVRTEESEYGERIIWQ